MYQEYVQKRIWGTKSLLTLNWYGLGVCGLWIFPHVFIIFPQYFRGCNFILPPSEHGRKSSQVPPGEREPWAKRSLWSAVCVCMCQGVRSRTECVWLWRTEFPYNSPSGSADLLPQPYVLVNFPNVWATFSTVYLLTLRVTFYVTCVFFCVAALEILHLRDALLSETLAACVTLLKRGQLGRGMGIGVGAATVCVSSRRAGCRRLFLVVLLVICSSCLTLLPIKHLVFNRCLNCFCCDHS